MNYVKRFNTILIEANIAVDIVTKMKTLVDTIISRGDLVTSAMNITITLPAQTRPIRRIILTDTLTFLTKPSIIAKGKK